MSQRTTQAGAAAEAAAQQENGAQQQQALPPQHYLQSKSRLKIPEWYQDGPFRYSLRMWVGFAPGALLMSIVAGKLVSFFHSRFIAVAVLGILVTLLVRSTGLKWPSMILSLASVLVMEVVNTYCMAPLMWRSVLNIPLFLLFHVFIGISGVWWWLQDSGIKRQEPTFSILLERLVFMLYPAVSVTMVTWVCGMLFGRSVLPFSICIAGIIALSLYVVPLQSSFTKPQTPTNMGVIQFWVVALLYLTLELCVPALVFTALSYSASLQSMLTLGLLIVSPLFLMTLLESQGLFYWTGLGPKAVQFIRWTSGAFVMAVFSVLVYASRPTSHLPLLLVPTLFAQLGLLSTVEHSSVAFAPPVLAVVMGLLYTTAFTFLPWTMSYPFLSAVGLTGVAGSIVPRLSGLNDAERSSIPFCITGLGEPGNEACHYFTFLSLPLNVVQLLLWGLAMATVAIVPLWKSVSSQVWLGYSCLLVLSEYVLCWDGVYPPYLAMATGLAAVLLFWRLHSVGHMTLNTCLPVISLHVTKLSLLLPSPPHTLTLSSLTTIVAIFLISSVLLRLLVFGNCAHPVTPSQLLVLCGVLLIGLLLSLDVLITPLWATLNHRLPSTASLVAIILTVVGLFVAHGVTVLPRQSSGKLQYLPQGLLVLAGLLAFLQPEFNLQELIESLMVVLFNGRGAGPLPDDVILAAWSNLLEWVTVITTLLTLGSIASALPSYLSTALATCLGAGTGFLTAIALLHSPPLSVLSFPYGVLGGITAILLARAYTTKLSGGILDRVLFVVLFTVFLLSLYGEWRTLSHAFSYKPIKGRIIPNYTFPCTQLLMTATALIATAFRAKMYNSRNQPYLPLVGNTCCVLFFLLALLNPLHARWEISVVLSSCILLLAQPDSLLLPRSDGIFPAPSLLASVVVLYCTSFTYILYHKSSMFSRATKLYIASRLVELLCLVGSIPGQLIFLYYLWTGRHLKLSVFYLAMYILPNSFLPQFASSPTSTLLGCIGVLSFCLLMIGDYPNLKIF